MAKTYVCRRWDCGSVARFVIKGLKNGTYEIIYDSGLVAPPMGPIIKYPICP